VLSVVPLASQRPAVPSLPPSEKSSALAGASARRPKIHVAPGSTLIPATQQNCAHEQTVRSL
jgi:hypothetical protein